MTDTDSIYGCNLSYWNKHYAVSFHFIHTHNVIKRRYLLHENSCLALSQKNETNKNNPQLLDHVIFIYVAGSIQVPFDRQKLTNNRNIYQAIGGPQSLIWLKWNPKCCCCYKNTLWSTWNCEHSHYDWTPFFTSLVTSACSTVQHPTINNKTLLNIAVTPRSLDPVSVMYCNITFPTHKKMALHLPLFASQPGILWKCNY